MGALQPASERPPGSGWSRARILFLSISFGFLAVVLWWANEVLLPFVLALILAYVLTPLVALCERWRLGRPLSIIVVYVVTLSSLYLLIALIAPRIYLETTGLVRESPVIARKLAAQWGPVLESQVEGLLGTRPEASLLPEEPLPAALEIQQQEDGSLAVRVGSGVDIVRESPNHWRVYEHGTERGTFRLERLLSDGVEDTVEYLKTNALALIRVGQAILSRVTRGVFLGFMTLMVAGYLMQTRDDIIAFFRSLVPAAGREGFDRLLKRIDLGISGVVRGQLLICAVNGGLSAIGFAFLGLDYWPVLALVAGVLSIIPIFGSILSTIPAVVIALTKDVWTALWVLFWILGIHQLEANLLNPKIIGATARLHPVLVVFVLIIGEHFFGLWGALLAVPILSLLKSVFNHFRLECLPDSAPADDVLPPRPL